MTGPGYRAAPSALTGAADGIEAVVGELATVTSAGRAESGRGVSELELDPDQFGHDELASAFSSFCGRWEWGVRGLAQAGTEMATGLRESGQAYAQADTATGSVFSRLLSDAIGDPTADPAQTARRSPAEIELAARSEEGPGAWSATGDSMARTWSGVAADALATDGGRIARALTGQNPYADEVDALHEIGD